MLAGYLASTRSSNDPDLRRNADDEHEDDYDYNHVTQLGSFDLNRPSSQMLAGAYCSPINGYSIENPAGKPAKKEEPGFLDTFVSSGKQQAAAAAQGAKKAAATAVSNTAQSAIDSAAGLAASKINSALGVSSGSGKLFKKTQLPEWKKAILIASVGSDRFLFPVSVKTPSILPSGSPFIRARFFGSLPSFASVLDLAKTNTEFLKSINVSVPPAEMLKGSTAVFIYANAVLKAFRDAGLLDKLKAGQVSPQEGLSVLSKFPFAKGVFGKKFKLGRPNIFPNKIGISFNDGAEAWKCFKFYESKIDAIDAVLNKNGFYTAPMSELQIRQAASEIYSMYPNSEKYMVLSFEPVTAAVSRIEESDPLRAKEAELAAQVLTEPAARAEEEEAAEEAPVETRKGASDAKKEKSFFASPAGIATICVVVAGLGFVGYKMSQQKD